MKSLINYVHETKIEYYMLLANILARIPSLISCFALFNFSISDNGEGHLLICRAKIASVMICTVSVCVGVAKGEWGTDSNSTCLRSSAISLLISRMDLSMYGC